MANGLTGRQRKFAEEYLVDFNATGAALRSGYAKSAASAAGGRNLKRPGVRKLLARRAQRLASVASVTPEKVIHELATIAFANIQEMFTDQDGTLEMRPLTELPDVVTRAIADVTIESKDLHSGGQTRRVRVKMWNKIQALERLTDYLKLFVPDPTAHTIEVRHVFIEELHTALERAYSSTYGEAADAAMVPTQTLPVERVAHNGNGHHPEPGGHDLPGRPS